MAKFDVRLFNTVILDLGVRGRASGGDWRRKSTSVSMGFEWRRMPWLEYGRL